MKQPSSVKLVAGTGVALHYQVKEILHQQIIGGELKPGAKLPPEVELAAQLGVSRTTVRQAILTLVHEGFLTRYQGKGTFVAQPKLHGDLRGYLGLSVDPKSQKILLHKTLIQATKEAEAEVASRLQIAPKNLVIYIKRVRLVEEEPIVLEQFHVPQAVCPDLVTADISDIAVHTALQERFGIAIRSVKSTIEAAIAGDNAHDLAIRRGDPALRIRRVFYDQNGPVLYAHALARGDRCQYHLED